MSLATRPVMLYTTVWGGYVDWFRHALCRSLSWPKNKAALNHRDTKWYIWGDLDDTQRIYEAATTVLPFHQIELKPKVMDRGQVNLLACMMQTMRRCLDDKLPMITAPPDTIFSEGCIDALLAYGASPETCVAIPHPRTQPAIIRELGPEPPRNSQLVTWALEKYTHDAWRTSNIELPVGGIHVGGVAWQKLRDHLYAVQHRLPTVYLANFNEEDRKFFSRPYKNIPPQYGMWDHEWPGANLIPHQRQRTIGSSDVAFIVECTEYHKNVPSQRLHNTDDPTVFHRDEFHNRVNAMYYSCFRGEA